MKRVWDVFVLTLAQLERRQQELQELKVQIDLANQKLTADRAALDGERKQLTDEQQQARRLAADQGFQDSLNLYNSMPPRQVKAVFLTLSDEAVMQYLQSMHDSLGTPVTVDVTAVLESQSTAGNTWRFYVDSGDKKAGGLAVDNGTLTFDNNGKLLACCREGI